MLVCAGKYFSKGEISECQCFSREQLSAAHDQEHQDHDLIFWTPVIAAYIPLQSRCSLVQVASDNVLKCTSSQVGDELCQLSKPPGTQMCSVESACQVSSGVDCSGNGLCSASAGKCICNQGWQVRVYISKLLAALSTPYCSTH